MLTAKTMGLDISDRFTSYCLLDGTGEVMEEGRLRTTADAYRQRLSCVAGRVVIEAGTHSPWVSRLFEEADLEVVVANPRRVRHIAQANRKNDRADAETLARLGRLDQKLLGPIKHRSAQAQADLAVVRARASLISARTLLINHVRGVVKSVGMRLPVCDATTFHKVARLHIPDGWQSLSAHCLTRSRFSPRKSSA